ncbi:MAG: hypothetical protein ACREQF_02200 [Candidatus Binataceae bacterium]
MTDLAATIKALERGHSIMLHRSYTAASFAENDSFKTDAALLDALRAALEKAKPFDYDGEPAGFVIPWPAREEK